ncbi:MAG TPA: 50S ribosomal protein L29 [archaeon]|nr:50S ribosomal protein L29 [archaeon]
MGKKKLAVLRDTSIPDMEEKIVELRGILSKERAVISSGTRAEKPSKISNTRKQIARLLTLINEKKLGVKK